jgi:hypothetical protein
MCRGRSASPRRYEGRRPLVSAEAKKVRARKIIRELATGKDGTIYAGTDDYTVVVFGI